MFACLPLYQFVNYRLIHMHKRPVSIQMEPRVSTVQNDFQRF